MTKCPECDVIDYGINPRCVSCVRKVMGERIEEMEAAYDIERVRADKLFDTAECSQARIAELEEAIRQHMRGAKESNAIAYLDIVVEKKKAELATKLARIAELEKAAREVHRISDRDHDAWHRLAALLGGGE